MQAAVGVILIVPAFHAHPYAVMVFVSQENLIIIALQIVRRHRHALQGSI